MPAVLFVQLLFRIGYHERRLCLAMRQYRYILIHKPGRLSASGRADDERVELVGHHDFHALPFFLRSDHDSVLLFRQLIPIGHGELFQLPQPLRCEPVRVLQIVFIKRYVLRVDAVDHEIPCQQYPARDAQRQPIRLIPQNRRHVLRTCKRVYDHEQYADERERYKPQQSVPFPCPALAAAQCRFPVQYL